MTGRRPRRLGYLQWDPQSEIDRRGEYDPNAWRIIFESEDYSNVFTLSQWVVRLESRLYGPWGRAACGVYCGGVRCCLEILCMGKYLISRMSHIAARRGSRESGVPNKACQARGLRTSELSLSPPSPFSYLAQILSSSSISPSPSRSPLVPMADLYPPAHSRSPQQYPYTRHTDSQQSPTYQSTTNGQMVYPPQLVSSQHSNSSNASSDENHNEPPSPSKSNPDHQPPKTESKPQATFLTKLYAYVFNHYS